MKVGKVTESIFDGVTAVIPLAEVCYVVKFTNCIDIHFKSGHELYLSPPDQNSFLAAWCRYRGELEADTLMDFEEAQPTPIIPEGWVLVPIEPTPVMKTAGIGVEVYQDSPPSTDCLTWGEVEAIYSAMIAAAPEAKP